MILRGQAVGAGAIAAKPILLRRLYRLSGKAGTVPIGAVWETPMGRGSARGSSPKKRPGTRKAPARRRAAAKRAAKTAKPRRSSQAKPKSEAARLASEVREARQRQAATADILKVIASSPSDVQPVFETIVVTAARLLRCDSSFIMRCDGAIYSAVAAATLDGLRPVLDAAPRPVDPAADFPSRAIATRKNLYLPDWSKIKLPAFERMVQERRSLKSALYLPMLREDRCIGVLGLASRHVDNFAERDVALAESFRDQALIAIENARLFNETREALERQTATADILKEVASHLTGKAGFEPAKTSVETHRKLLEAIGEDAELVATEDLLTDLRRVKDEAEIEAIAAAAALTDEVYAWIEERGLVGRTERDVALAAEARMRELGAEDPSFPAIVASGPNGALPHAVPGDRVIGAGEYVTIDMGAIVDGYCSDCTRTLVEGDPDPAQKQVYDLVLASQLAALDAIRPGAHGREVDAISREPIAEAGYGERYGHGLGHGVGIEVHEPPRLSKRSDDTLLVGDVVTVEPGIYIPGEFGVRIEDLVVVAEDGYRNLSSRPK